MTRHLITSALPYINGVKHLGNLIGSMLPADIYARYLRLRGEEVLFICATDEHGTPTELAAKEAGLEVAEFCRIQHEVQRDIGERFGLSWDHFGRSSSAENRELTQHFAARLDAEGYLEERTTKQVYSPVDGRFLPDRYIIGTCPYCGYPNARGDQCENCTRVLDPTDLIDPRSAISGSTDLEVRETKHLYLLQSKLVDEVAAWIEEHADVWPALTLSIARKWITEGVQDRGITRDIDWGVPVIDRPGFEDKVFYVWFDAPIEYIGATAEWAAARPRRARLAQLVVRRRRRRVHAVHGQGQRAVPHGVVPGHPHRVTGALEAGRPDQGLQLAHLLRRQVLHEPGPRRVHGPGPRHLPRRLLALVPVRQRARVERRQLHVGRLHRRGQQGPGRLLRQPRQPLPHPVGQALRPGGAGRWRPGEREEQLEADLGGGRCGPTPSSWRPRSCASPPTSCAGHGDWPTPTGSRPSRGRS